jgi:hypothetical protein
VPHRAAIGVVVAIATLLYFALYIATCPTYMIEIDMLHITTGRVVFSTACDIVGDTFIADGGGGPLFD